jgi:hypothetical protein
LLGVFQSNIVYGVLAATGVILGAADEEAVRIPGGLVDDLRGVHGDVRGLADPGAVEIAGQGMAGRIEHDGEVDPLIRGDRRAGYSTKGRSAEGYGSAEARGGTGVGRGSEEAVGYVLPEIEEPLPGSLGIEEKPPRDADRVFTGQGIAQVFLTSKGPILKMDSRIFSSDISFV